MSNAEFRMMKFEIRHSVFVIRYSRGVPPNHRTVERFSWQK